MTYPGHYDTVSLPMNLVFRSCAMLTALLLGAVSVVSAADSKEFTRRKAPPKKYTGVNFAEPEVAGQTNRVEDNLLPKPSLGSIDKAVRKPFELFKPEDSLDLSSDPSVRRPPPRPPTRQELRKKDVQANWVFSTPEEILGLPSAEALLDPPEFGPNGERKAPKTSFERYLERRESERLTASTNQTASMPLPGWARPEESADEPGNARGEGKASADEPGKAGSAQEKGRTEARQPGGYEFLPMNGQQGAWAQTTPGAGGLFNFNSAGTAESPALKNAAHEQRMQEFRQLLEHRPASSPTPTWAVGGTAALASPATVTPPSAFPYSTPYKPAAFTPPPAAPLASPTLGGPAASTPGYLAPAYPAAPAATSTRPQPSPSPFGNPFDLPRRKF